MFGNRPSAPEPVAIFVLAALGTAVLASLRIAGDRERAPLGAPPLTQAAGTTSQAHELGGERGREAPRRSRPRPQPYDGAAARARLGAAGAVRRGPRAGRAGPTQPQERAVGRQATDPAVLGRVIDGLRSM